MGTRWILRSVPNALLAVGVNNGRHGEGSLFVRIDRLEPLVFPEHQAPSLASSVSLAVAADAVQMHGAADHPSPADAVGRIARLVRTLEDLQPRATELEHLRHERQRIELSL